MKLIDAARLSALVKAYEKRLRQVESVQRRTTRLLDAIDDAELTEDVRTSFEAIFDDASDAIVAAFAAMRRVGSDADADADVGDMQETDTNGHEGDGRRHD
jgi:hypothetical protein